MTRALLTASTFPLRRGDGLPRFVYDLAEALTDHCDVTALVPGAPGVARRERMGRVDVRRFTYFLPRRAQRLAYGHGIPDNLRTSRLARLQVPGYFAAQALAIRSCVRREGIDVVNSHWLIPQGLSGALARGRSPRFRHVVTLHGGDSYMIRRLPFGRQLARFVLARADHVFAVSSNVRDNLDAVLGRESGAEIQPVGVRLDHFASGDALDRAESPFPDGYLLFVGRLIAIKGVEVLLRALARVRERHPGLGLVVIGYGPLEPALRQEAGRIGVADAVVFRGRQDHAEIGRQLRGCRVAAVPSIVDVDGRAEGMPSAVIEAMASGARVVGSEAGGIPDVIRHAENGWLCRPGDDEDLAAKLLAALADPSDSGVVERAQRTAEAFDWPRVAERYAAVFGA